MARDITWKQAFIGYLLILLFIPTDVYKLPSGLPFDLQLDRILLFLIIAVWLAALLIDTRVRLVLGQSGAPVIVFMFVAAFSQVVNFPFNDGAWFDAAVKRLIYMASFALGFFFINSVFGRREIESILKWIVGFGAVVAFSGVIERLYAFNVFHSLHYVIPILKPTVGNLQSGIYRAGQLRIVASSAHPIALSVALAMLMPLALHFWLTSRRRFEKAFYYCASALMLTALFMTVSRSGVLTLLAAVAVWSALRGQDTRKLTVHLLVLLLSLYIWQPKLVETMRSFFFPKQGFLKEGSVKGRIVDYPLVGKKFKSAPLFGLGFEMFKPKKNFFVDNQYLAFALEIGGLGLLAVFWLFGSIIWHIYKGVADDRGPPGGLLVAILSAIIGFLVASAFYDSFGFHQARSLFFILSALGIKYAADGEGRPEAEGGRRE